MPPETLYSIRITERQACDLIAEHGLHRIEPDDVLMLFVLADSTDDYVHWAMLDCDTQQWWEHADGTP